VVFIDVVGRDFGGDELSPKRWREADGHK
jgi:hypothetical protein